MIAFEPRDALFDRKARLHRVGHRTNAGQAREAPVRAIRVHGIRWFALHLTRTAKKTTSIFAVPIGPDETYNRRRGPSRGIDDLQPADQLEVTPVERDHVAHSLHRRRRP